MGDAFKLALTGHLTQSMLDALDEGVVVLDADDVIIAANGRVFDILQGDRSIDIVGKHIADTIDLHGDLNGLPKHELEKEHHIRTKLIAGGYHDGGPFQERRLLRNGRTVEVRRRPLEHSQVILTLRDVSAEAELERRTAQLETVVENTDNGVFQIDRNGRIELFNQRMAELYRLDQTDVRVGDHVSKFVSHFIASAEMDDEALQIFQAIDDETSGLELPLIREQAVKTIWGTVLEVSRVRLPGGGALATHRDITAQHRQQVLLEEARFAAEDTSRLKSEFIARVTHELRTPMHGVLGLAALLERSGLNEVQLRFLDTLQRSGRHMVDLIDGLLTISTLEAGDVVLDLHDARLDLLLEDCFEMLRPNATEKGIQYDLVCDLPVNQAVADGTRLTQIIVNLLANAIKFTQAGRVSLTATTTSEAGRVHLSVAISDTGIGIPPAKLDQIFEKFTQLGGIAGACSEGVGLGLSIAMSLTELMGGTLSVRSEEGEGSVFTLQLGLDAVQSGAGETARATPDVA